MIGTCADCSSSSSWQPPSSSLPAPAAPDPHAGERRGPRHDVDRLDPVPPRRTSAPATWRTTRRDGLRGRGPRPRPARSTGEPLVIGDTLVVATERNYVYGLNARSGATRWRVQLGPPQPQSELPCGNIDPLGITSTPAYDGTTRSVFVVAETRGGTHTLWALGVGAGHRKWHRTLDTQADRSKLAEQQRSALLVTQGRVLTAFGGLAGDCSNYVGYVTSVPVSGRGATTSYAVPTAREAGMWATPGPIREGTEWCTSRPATARS